MKRVTMFLWNNFTNDARVFRESNALVEVANEITIIAKRDVNEKFLKKKEILMNKLNILRIDKPAPFIRVVETSKYNTIINKHIPNMLLMTKMIFEGYNTKTDIFHSHDLNTLIQGVVCSKFRLNKKPLIFDSHEVNTSRTNYNTQLIGKIERFLLKFVDYTIVENDTRADYHQRLYNYRPIALHNYSEYFDVEELKPKNLNEIVGIPDEQKILLYQGGLQEGRGLDILISAFSKSDVNAKLVFIGDGKMKAKLIQQVESLEMSHKIKFIDRVPYADLKLYTMSAYVGFQVLQNTNFNHYSASSNKLYEYMMCHVPVIGSDLPEIKKVILSEDIGLVVRESNENDLIKAIQTLTNDENLRAHMAERMKIAKQKYNWNKEKNILLDLYQRIGDMNDQLFRK